MQIDRRALFATLGTAADRNAMSSEELADALEHHMIENLDAEGTTDELKVRLGTGVLFGGPLPDAPTELKKLEPMPEKPTLVDFFKYRFAPATVKHVLQSATDAMKKGEKEELVLACLLHDVVLNLIKVDHGWWGAQMMEPYVSEKISWGIRYHQALRFYPDPSVGYEYPELYNKIFGKDYMPPPLHQASLRVCPQSQVIHGRAHDHCARHLRFRSDNEGLYRSVHRHHRSSLQTTEGRARVRQ